jgi:Fn3 associated
VREADAESPGVSGPVHSVTATIKTATTGAYLRYTLDGSTPTGGTVRSWHANSSGARESHVQFRGEGSTLKAIAYKAGWIDSLIAVGEYAYESGRRLTQEHRGSSAWSDDTCPKSLFEEIMRLCNQS